MAIETQHKIDLYRPIKAKPIENLGNRLIKIYHFATKNPEYLKRISPNEREQISSLLQYRKMLVETYKRIIIKDRSQESMRNQRFRLALQGLEEQFKQDPTKTTEFIKSYFSERHTNPYYVLYDKLYAYKEVLAVRGLNNNSAFIKGVNYADGLFKAGQYTRGIKFVNAALAKLR